MAPALSEVLLLHSMPLNCEHLISPLEYRSLPALEQDDRRGLQGVDDRPASHVGRHSTDRSRPQSDHPCPADPSTISSSNMVTTALVEPVRISYSPNYLEDYIIFWNIFQSRKSFDW